MTMEEVETKLPKCELDCEEDSSKCRRCDELEERSKKDEARVVELEKEIEKRKKEFEELEAKFRELEARNNSAEVELKAFRTGNNEKNKVDLTGEGDGENVIDELMVENCVLECEKRKAESEVAVWKDKYKELELQVSLMDVGSRTIRGEKPLLDDDVKGGNRSPVEGLGASVCVPQMGIDNSGTPDERSPRSHTPLAGKAGICLNFEGRYCRKIIKHLSFDKERNLSKKISPQTPETSKPAHLDVINVFDSDDESDNHVSTEHVVAEILDAKKDEVCLQDYEEDVNEFRDKIPFTITSKRKRVAKMVTSDTESDEDDNVPISQLKKTRNQEGICRVENSDVNVCLASPSSSINGNAQFGASHTRRRLVTLRQCEEEVTKQEQVRPTSDDVDGESEEVGSESEGGSLGGFIVNSSSNASSAHDVPSHSVSESEDFDEILSKLERNKDRKCEWELAEMLSAFGKDLELCMRAVCALYRQQTSDEQVNKESKYENNRGFSKPDALRGTELALFLTEGDPEGDLKKSKQQLEEYSSSAVDLCRTLATRYSKQLFEIYKNKEDPLFLPYVDYLIV